jgi:periplasmic protein CpxP/Spy
MKINVLFLMLLSAVVLVSAIPSSSIAQDVGIEVMAQKLKLDQSQITMIVELTKAYKQKQAAISSLGDVLLENQTNLKQVLTTSPFNRARAQQIVDKITATVGQTIMNRLEVRNQVYQVLSPEQQGQYVIMVKEALAHME